MQYANGIVDLQSEHCIGCGYCVAGCPFDVPRISKEDNKAEERVAEMKTRGFEQAGVYDPQGVGDTHVMYVLQHADKPGLYHKLPEDPKIINVVQSWKGWFKPLAALGFLTALAGATVHYISAGPNEVEDDDGAAETGGQKKDGSQP